MHVGIFDSDRSGAATFLLPASGAGGCHRRGSLRRRFRLDQRWQSFLEGFARLGEHNSVLRAPGPGETWLDRAQIEREQFGVLRLGRLVVVKEALLAAIGFNEGDLFFAASSELEVAQAFFIDWEDAARGAVFRRHVGDGGAVGQRQIAQAGAEIFNELANDAVLAQHLGDGQNEIGRGRAFTQTPGKLHAYHQWDQHRHRLSEHRGFRLDSANAPSQNSQPIDHGGVAVGSDQRIRIGNALAWRFLHEDHARQVLKIYLVHNARVGRNDRQIVESGLAPT